MIKLTNKKIVMRSRDVATNLQTPNSTNTTILVNYIYFVTTIDILVFFRPCSGNQYYYVK